MLFRIICYVSIYQYHLANVLIIFDVFMFELVILIVGILYLYDYMRYKYTFSNNTLCKH